MKKTIYLVENSSLFSDTRRRAPSAAAATGVGASTGAAAADRADSGSPR